jgi:Zn-dependent alcohol dehydrogenase
LGFEGLDLKAPKLLGISLPGTTAAPGQQVSSLSPGTHLLDHRNFSYKCNSCRQEKAEKKNYRVAPEFDR